MTERTFCHNTKPWRHLDDNSDFAGLPYAWRGLFFTLMPMARRLCCCVPTCPRSSVLLTFTDCCKDQWWAWGNWVLVFLRHWHPPLESASKWLPRRWSQSLWIIHYTLWVYIDILVSTSTNLHRMFYRSAAITTSNPTKCRLSGRSLGITPEHIRVRHLWIKKNHWARSPEAF